MTHTDVGSQFMEAAVEWGLDEVTLEDAAFAYHAPYGQSGSRRREAACYLRCSKSVLDWIRPGKWDRW